MSRDYQEIFHIAPEVHAGRWSVGGQGGRGKWFKRLQQHSETTSSACLVRRHQDVHSHSSGLGVRPRHCHKPSVWNVCVFLSHSHTHTQHPSLCTPIVPSAGQSRLRIIQLLRHVIVCMYTFKVCTTHTHTHKVHGTFCVAPVLSLSGSPVSAAGGYSPPPLLSLVQWHSVGAGRDGFVQLQVQGSRAELQAAVAGLTDAAGLEQLLAWHWDLLVTAAGTEHVTAVPAGRNTKVTAGLSDRASLHLMLPCVSSLHLHQGLFFRHEQLCELDRIVIHLIKVWISNLFNADQELGYNLQKWKLPELIWMIF